MTTKEAMAASDKDIGVMMVEAGHDLFCGCELDHAWPLIPRDHKDENYQKFWRTMLVISELTFGTVGEVQRWLLSSPDPARVARIICVAWLYLKTKGE